MADDPFDSEPAPRRSSASTVERAAARRTYRRRRILAGGGAVVVLVLLVGVCGVVYGVWKFNQIDRTDLDLPEVASGEPQNYLIVGSDSRAPATEVPDGGSKVAGPVEGKRSDTILVVRIDPDEKKAKMLSLPRDLWVTLADTGERQRINAAFNHGEQALVDTITAELDIPINHFLEVDFNGFQGLVKAVDGVPMYFDRAMRDRQSGLEVLHPGCVTLDPTQALAFARSRHLEYMDDGRWRTDPTGDLGRISRQQLFMRRSISRAVERGLRNPLTLKDLVDVGASNVSVDDDLSVQNLMALGRRFADFDAEHLETFTLPVDPDRTDGGADILRLRETEAEAVLTLFRDRPDPDDPPTTDGTAALQPTDAPVQVLNGSGINGQAKQVSAWLEAIGFTAGTTGNASEIGLDDLETTLIRHGPDGRAQADLLSSRLVGGATIEKDPSLERDELLLVTGSDFGGIKGDDGEVLEAGAAPSNASAENTTTTTATTAPPSSEDAAPTTTTTIVGRTPGDPPPGETCG
jgi:LCP family protein required for cell wall assembly